MKNNFTLDTQVVLLFENKKRNFPSYETVGWYLEQMESDIGAKDCLYPWFGMRSYDELWEQRMLACAIVSWLTYIFEYDDLSYMFKNNEILICRMDIKDKVR